MELYKKYRPKKLKDVVGQESIKEQLKVYKKEGLPHFILFSGKTGCGKTTLARIIAKWTGCDLSSLDFQEVNGSDKRGIDDVREIIETAKLLPLYSKARVFIIDECHQMTKDAANSFLKILEDTPETTYFIFCTTEEEKLLPAIKNRAVRFKLSELDESELSELLNDVCSKENVELSDDVIEKIVETAEGSARNLLTILDAVYRIDDEESQLEAVSKEAYSKQGIDLARLLCNAKSVWGDVTKCIKELDGEPEAIRYIVLGYCSSVLLNQKGMKNEYAERVIVVMQAFSENFYNTKKAGIVLACSQIFHDV